MLIAESNYQNNMSD